MSESSGQSNFVEQGMDPISALAKASLLAHSGEQRYAITEKTLRSSLPDIGRRPESSTMNIAFEMAGLTGQSKRIAVHKLRDSDCPFILVNHADSNTSWHIISSVAHAGLATEMLADGTTVPVALEQLANGKTLTGWRIAVLDGPKRSRRRHEAQTHRLSLSFWPAKRIIPPLVLATFAINILALAIPLATMNIFDRVISNAAFETLWMLAIGVVLALVFDFLLRSLRVSVLDRSSAREDVLVSNGVFSRILGARMNARRMGVGAQVNGLRELDTVREYFNASALAALGDLPFVALYLLVIWLVAGHLVLVPLIAVPLFLCTAVAIQFILRRIVEGAFNDTSHKNTVSTEILTGMESIKLSGGEQWAAGRWERAVASQLRHSLAVRFWTNLSLHLITFFQGAVTISLLVVGVYAVTEGTITPGALFAANLLASRCLGPLVAVSALVARWTHVRMARDTVKQLSSMESERPAGRQLVTPSNPVQSLEMKDVAFAYSEDSPTILKNISLRVGAGERIAVIGGIGSGKTTLMHLISGLHMPTSGQVLIDGLSSTDMDLDDWRAIIGAAPQSPAFFAGTVREAVTIGRVADDLAVSKALALAGADQWVAKTGLGLDTPVGERGHGLSGGQLQTLSIARAVLGNPQILLMDEPTSHMDGRSETAFAARLSRLAHRPTTITITHRPAMIEAADRLIVMEGGAIILDGPRQKVMEQLRQVVTDRTSGSGSGSGSGKAEVG